jgi:MerR family transcriptional regulator, light-induced transcriptional regulator
MSQAIANHRIGAISALSGVPVSTLRVWEVRHGAFTPAKSKGRHRLYSDEDALRASLIRQLTDSGHSISTLAKLPATQLNELLHQQRNAGQRSRPAAAPQSAITVAVVGVGMAARMASGQLGLGLSDKPIQITEILEDLDEAAKAPMPSRPQVLVVRVNSLHVLAGNDIQRLVHAHPFQQAIVLYNFGQEPVIAGLKMAGIKVRREPISNAELGELINSVLWLDHTAEASDVQRSGLVPPRKYSDATLQQVANSPNQVLCECPRHVAELISQLASFEQYSQECLNKSAEDAHLHAYLSSVSGSARALFEKALEMVAQHENITLPQIPSWGAQSS